MKKSLISLVLAASLAIAAAAQAQTLSLNYSPRTGDVWVDARLGEINTYGRGDPDYFYDDLYSSFGVPRDYVRELYVDRRWAPGDIYFACALAELLDRPCREIVSDYDRHPGQGWGALAQRMGIKPGSAEFHELKGRVGKGHGKLKSHGGPQGRGNQGPSSSQPGESGQDGGHPGKGEKEEKSKGNGRGGH